MQQRSGTSTWQLPSVALRPARLTLPPLGGGAYAFWLSLTVYLAVALVLVFQQHQIVGDAWSRVGNAHWVLFSRDPHLAAIGFVWNPLPSAVLLPLLPLKSVWPELVTHGFAANIVSAAFMAVAVVEVHRLVIDLRVPKLAGAGLTAGFALHPLIILYGANGMSEAAFVCFTLMATRRVMRWLVSGSVGSLASTGLILALAYLTRYEAVALGGAAILLVATVSYRRSHASRAERMLAAAADGLIVGAPFIAAVALWALASWIIMGNPFETFRSVYGSTSQLALAGSSISQQTGQGTMDGWVYLTRQLLGLAPAAALLVALATAKAAWMRDPRVLALGLPLAAIAFSVWSFVSGHSFGWLRFYILAVPLAVMAAGLLLGHGTHSSSSRASERAAAGSRIGGLARAAMRPTALLAAAITVGLVLAGLPAGTQTLLDRRLAREETATDEYRAGFEMASAVSAYVDALELKDGAVLIDVAVGYGVVLQSHNPEQFVITPDRDFQAIVQDPSNFGVRYFLVSDYPLDALNRSYGDVLRLSSSPFQLVEDWTWRTSRGSFQVQLYELRA